MEVSEEENKTAADEAEKGMKDNRVKEKKLKNTLINI